MALTAAAQMCSGVGKSGSPRLKSKTATPWALSWRARAPAASVADGCTAAAMRETETGASFLDIFFGPCGAGGRPPRRAALAGGRARAQNEILRNRAGRCEGTWRMRIAHFVQRYPPALGGSEAYFARLGRFLAAAGDNVTVFTTTALDLEAFWSRRGRCLPAGV